MSKFDLSDTTYTAYTWTPQLFLNDKQCGIQSAHCISDMSLLNNEIYQKWAEDHKTLIMFRGTNCGTVRRIFHILQHAKRNLKLAGIDIPVVKFHEDEESLDGAITATAMVFPDNLRQFTFDEKFASMDGHYNYYPLQLHYGDFPEAWDVTTRAYYDEIVHREDISSRAIMSSYPLEHEKFSLVEFSEWMRNQQLV